MHRRVRQLTATSAAMTFVLVLLGVYTAADGAGLTCAGAWPLCDGAVFGLFPANWPSFVEWFHRLWAMITGLVIVGTAVLGFRTGAATEVRWALAGATLLLPSQVILGGLTVTRYESLILLGHFLTAMTIFTLVAFAALRASETALDIPGRRVGLLTAAVALFPVYLLFSPRVVLVYSEAVQVGFYSVGMLIFGATLATALTSSGRIRYALVGAGTVLFAELVVGRQTYGADGERLMLLGAGLAFAMVVYALTAERRDRSRSAGLPSAQGD